MFVCLWFSLEIPQARIKLFAVKVGGNHPPVSRTDDAPWMSLKEQTQLALTSR